MLRSIIQLYKNSLTGLSREIWLLTFVTLINRSGTIVTLFLTIYVTDQLGYSKTQAGIAASCFGIGSLLGGFIGGYLTDRIGYYKVMFYSLLSVGFMFFILMYLRNFYFLCGGIIVTNMIGDTFRPASSASLGAYSTKENHTRSLSLYRLAINLGFALGAGAAGWIASRFGYDWLFIIDGATCIAAAFMFILLLPNKEDQEKATEEESANVDLRKSHSAYNDHWYLLFLFCLFLNAVAFMQLFSSFPVFCKEVLGFSEADVGNMMAFNGFIIVLLEMPLVYLIVQRKQQMETIIGGVMLIGFSFLIYNILGFYWWVAVLSMILVSVGEIINFPFTTTIALQRSRPYNRGEYMGLFTVMFSSSAIFAPIIGLWVAEQYSFTHLWYLMSALSLLSFVGLLFLKGNASDKLVIDG